jgi:hypothetical protein
VGTFLRSQPTPVGISFNDQHHIIDIMAKFCSEPAKLRAFFPACINSVRINAGLQHLNLISHQLKTRIVPPAISGLKKLLEHLKHPQKPAHISSNPTKQILLKSNTLNALICFRAPRKVKEFVNLSKRRVSSHPKAGFEPETVSTVTVSSATAFFNVELAE